MEFSEPPPDILHSISNYVTTRLAEALANGAAGGACLA